jgi:hypothetical protein
MRALRRMSLRSDGRNDPGPEDKGKDLSMISRNPSRFLLALALLAAIDPDCSCVADSSGACVGRGPAECAGLAVRSVSNRGELAEAVARTHVTRITAGPGVPWEAFLPRLRIESGWHNVVSFRCRQVQLRGRPTPP